MFRPSSCLPSAFNARRVELHMQPRAELRRPRGSTRSVERRHATVVGQEPGRSVRRVGLCLSSKASSFAGVLALSSLTSTVDSRVADSRVADSFAAEARVASECYRFSSAVGAELGQNVADPVADALFGKYEAAGDDSVVQPLGDEVQDLSFAWC
jgi:hypothetical protein